MKLPLLLAVLVLSTASPRGLRAQGGAGIESAQIESLGSDLAVEWRRLGRLALQPVSEATRTLNAMFAASAREAVEINARLRFIESLRAESPDNPSLTEKLGRETGMLKRQAETLRSVVHDVSPGGRLDRLLGDLIGQAEALERSIGRRPEGGL